MNSSKKDANRTIQYSLTDFVPFCERQMIKFSGGVIFRSTAQKHRGIRILSISLVLKYGAKDMARVASGVVFNQVRCALLSYSASNFWLILYVWYLLCCCLCLVFTKSTVNQVSRFRGGWKWYCDGGGVGMHTRLGMIRQEIDMF